MAVPTFRRNTELTELLQSIEAQSVHPSLVLVVDNNPGNDAKRVVEAFSEGANYRVDYLPMGENTGPAGAFSRALTHLHGVEHIEWMMCRGDDNPFTDPESIAEMQAFSVSVAQLSPAGIGNRGVNFDRRRSCGVGISDNLLESGEWIMTDALPGGGSPTYNISRVLGARVNFDPFLFFGYEELDIGMKLRKAGMPLILNVEALKRIRKQFGNRERPGWIPSPWRTYYQYRNLLIIAKRYGSTIGLSTLLLKSIAKAVIAAARGRDMSIATAHIRGIMDGVFNRKPHARYVPGGPKKP